MTSEEEREVLRAAHAINEWERTLNIVLGAATVLALLILVLMLIAWVRSCTGWW